MLIITLHNDGTGDQLKGNYNYTVYINEQILDKGRIEGHARPSGWQGLVNRLAEKALEDKKEKDLRLFNKLFNSKGED